MEKMYWEQEPASWQRSRAALIVPAVRILRIWDRHLLVIAIGQFIVKQPMRAIG